MMNHQEYQNDFDVILAFLKLSRAMRRCPPKDGEFPFPPAVGRLMECVAANPGVSSRELCEALDVRPSSLSEMLARAESDGLITRAADENDRRVQRVSLSEKGRARVAEMETARNEDAKKKTSCLTEEEKERFCNYCNRLSEHIESLALDLPEDFPEDFPGPGRPGPGHPGPRPFPEKHPGHPPVPPGGRFRC